MRKEGDVPCPFLSKDGKRSSGKFENGFNVVPDHMVEHFETLALISMTIA